MPVPRHHAAPAALLLLAIILPAALSQQSSLLAPVLVTDGTQVGGTSSRTADYMLWETPAFMLSGNVSLTLQHAWIDGSNVPLWAGKGAVSVTPADNVMLALLGGLVQLDRSKSSAPAVTVINVTLQASCQRVAELQGLLCADSDSSMLSAAQVYPGEVQVQSAHLPRLNVNITNLRITCHSKRDMPTLTLAGIMAMLQQAASSPPTSQPEDANSTTSTVGGSGGVYKVPTMACAVAHVQSWRQMLQASEVLQPHASMVVMVLRANLTTSTPENEGDIPVYRRMVVTSSVLDSGANVSTWACLGYAQRRATWTLASNASIMFNGLTFVSLPLGPYNKLPWATFGWALWAVNMDRCQPQSQPPQVQVLNSTIVLPAEVMDYQAHWVAEANSPFPERVVAAKWYGVDATCDPPVEQPFLLRKARVMSQRWWVTPNATAFGVNFVNASFTDRSPPGVPMAGMPLQLTHMFDDPYPPFPSIAWVETAEQFVKELGEGSSSYMVLLRNISVPASAWPGGAAGGSVTVARARNLAISGWPTIRTYLDLQRQPSRINLSGPITLRNLALMNGAQEKRSPRSTWAANLTLLQWTFRYIRSQTWLQMRNVSIAVPESEFSLLLSSAASSSSDPASASPATSSSSPLLPGALPNSTLRLSHDRSITGSGAPGTFWAATALTPDGCLAVGVVVEYGMLGYNIVLESELKGTLPFPIINITVSLAAAHGALSFSPPPLASTGNDTAAEVQRTVAIAVPVGVSCILLAALGTLVWHRQSFAASGAAVASSGSLSFTSPGAAQEEAGSSGRKESGSPRRSSEGSVTDSEASVSPAAAALSPGGATGAATTGVVATAKAAVSSLQGHRRWRCWWRGSSKHAKIEKLGEAPAPSECGGGGDGAAAGQQWSAEEGKLSATPMRCVASSRHALAARAAGAAAAAPPPQSSPASSSHCRTSSGSADVQDPRCLGTKLPVEEADGKTSMPGRWQRRPSPLAAAPAALACSDDSGMGGALALPSAALLDSCAAPAGLQGSPAFGSVQLAPAPVALGHPPGAGSTNGASLVHLPAPMIHALAGPPRQWPPAAPLPGSDDGRRLLPYGPPQQAGGAPDTAAPRFLWSTSSVGGVGAGHGSSPLAAAPWGGGSWPNGSTASCPQLDGGSAGAAAGTSFEGAGAGVAGASIRQGRSCSSSSSSSSRGTAVAAAAAAVGAAGVWAHLDAGAVAMRSSGGVAGSGPRGAGAVAMSSSGTSRRSSAQRPAALASAVVHGEWHGPELEHRGSGHSIGSGFLQDDSQLDSFDVVPEHHEQLIINRMELSKELQDSITAPNVASQLKDMVANLQSELGDQEVEITRVIGQGGSGVVYKGTWRGLTVAIKTLVFTVLPMQPMSRKQHRAMTEAALCRTLQHPHIVATYAYNLHTLIAADAPGARAGAVADSSATVGGSAAQPAAGAAARAAGTAPHAMEFKLSIVQEFCDGGTLKAAIDDGKLHDMSSGKPRPVLSHILQLATDVAAGMSHVHSRRVVHGDLTPANVLLKSSPGTLSGWQAKVADFGLSWKLASGQEHVSNARQGTGFYIAPEVLHVGIMSKAADVFSYGMVLHEMYHGQPYWRRGERGGPAADANAALHLPGAEQLRWSPSCPKDFKELVCSCLCSDLQARPTFFQIVAQLLAMQRRMYVAEEQVAVAADADATVPLTEAPAWRVAGWPAGLPTSSTAAAPHQEVAQLDLASRPSTLALADRPEVSDGADDHHTGDSAGAGAAAVPTPPPLSGAPVAAPPPPGAAAVPALPPPGAAVVPEPPPPSSVPVAALAAPMLLPVVRSASTSLDVDSVGAHGGGDGPSLVTTSTGGGLHRYGSARQPTTGLLSERGIKVVWRNMRDVASGGGGGGGHGSAGGSAGVGGREQLHEAAPQELAGAEAWEKEGEQRQLRRRGSSD